MLEKKKHFTLFSVPSPRKTEHLFRAGLTKSVKVLTMKS